jgi:hypothetical protein
MTPANLPKARSAISTLLDEWLIYLEFIVSDPLIN